MFAAAAFLAVQLLLTPCAIKDIPGSVRCGKHRVWENRTTRRGRQIELSIVVLDALKDNHRPDPLFVLSGGPGDAPSFNAAFFSRVFSTIRQQRDIVLVDLRGTGKSHNLACPELLKPDASGLVDDQILGIQAVRQCRARLEKTSDLRQYTTEIAVDDLDEVRRALGYAQINLYGTSYGTRVAQVYMRRHPSSLRAVALKGIVPPSLASPETHARGGEAAWQQLVERCHRDEQCARHYPTLDSDFRKILKALESSPVIPIDGSPSGMSKLRVSSQFFAEAFRFNLYSPELMSRVPSIVRTLSLDMSSLFNEVWFGRVLLSSDRLAAGFFLSVSCTEDVPYLPRNLAPLVTNTFGGDYRLRQQINACTVWPRGKVSRQHRRPTKSSIPTLILSGEFDPVTPASGGEEVLRGLLNGRHVVIRNNGHPIGSAELCIGSMIAAFVDKGIAEGLDVSCAEKVPPVPFVIPK
jgi:pimeloyl-ACP methyl ester carboxylesterase